MEVSVFRNFWDKEPQGSTLEVMVEAIRSDERTRELTEGYRRQRIDGISPESQLFRPPLAPPNLGGARGGLNRWQAADGRRGQGAEQPQTFRTDPIDALKNESMLFAVPCIFEGGKAQKNVVRLTGLTMVDFDHVARDDFKSKESGI